MGEQQHREVNRRAGEHRGPICSCGAEFKVRPGSHTQLSRYPHSGQSVDSAKVMVFPGRYNEKRDGSKGVDCILMSGLCGN